MNPEQVKKIIETGMQSEDVHSLIVIVQGEMLNSYVDALADIDYKGKPVLCCVACKEFMMNGVIRMEQKGIPVYSTPEMAAEVLGEMYRYSRQCNKVMIKGLDRFLADKSFTVGNRSVALRLLTNHDIDLWTEFVNSCSPRSLWLRFLSPFSATPETAQRFCNINPDEEVAVVAEMTEDHQKKLIAIARLIRCQPSDEAEYAVIVTDSWQQNRLGRMLSTACLNLAKQLHFSVVNAETIQENFPIIKVLNHFHFKMKSKERNMILMSLRLMP
jgi:RimJ/RimL family protein N-acetyltransferase